MATLTIKNNGEQRAKEVSVFQKGKRTDTKAAIGVGESHDFTGLNKGEVKVTAAFEGGHVMGPFAVEIDEENEVLTIPKMAAIKPGKKMSVAKAKPKAKKAAKKRK